MDNYNALVINLESDNSAPKTDMSGATFVDAFLGGSDEEMSNLKGRGRRRRQKRKLDRTAKKRERKLAKVQAKDDVRSAKDETRLSRRAKRKSTRQQMRDDQMEARQGRKNKRMEMKESRRGSDEIDEDEDTLEDTTPRGESVEDEDTGSNSYSNEDDEDEDTGNVGDDVDSGQDNAGYDDSEDYDEYPTFDEDENFDGEQSNFVSELTGESSNNDPIAKVCMKIEWNNEMLETLARQKAIMESQGKDTAKIDQAISDKFDRVQSLEGSLENFVGADGSKAKRVKKSKTSSQTRASYTN